MKPSALCALLIASTLGAAFAAVGNPSGGNQGELASSTPHGEPLTIVKNGQPLAEIVVAPERPRMVTLGALELRHFIEKLTGARLPIVTEPTFENAVRIFVGPSPGTEELGITTEGLRDGAYKMVSGPDWVVLLGRDFDFEPGKYPVPLRRGDEAAAKQWEEATKGQTDTAWTNPFGAQFRRFWNPASFSTQLGERYGEDFAELWGIREGERPGIWEHDEGGTLNAVYGFLRSLGIRWFMAGDLGEVLPAPQPTLATGPFNETVVPDSPLRNWNWYGYGSFAFDDVIWARRLGMNSGYEQLGLLSGPHGLVPVHAHAAMREAHPEYYALLGGQRDTGHRDRGTPCFTSEGLINETVNYIRFIFDTYDLPNVDIWPVDGLRVCQCDGCQGKSASELVWEFSDRVAREVYQTHPDKLITGGAYTSYINAPDTIEQFSPNLAVWIANSARLRMTDPEHWAQYWDRVEKWQSKMAPGNILRLENNRYHIWGIGEDESGNRVRGLPLAYPVIHPRATARDLQALKGISRGDTGEQSQFGGKWKVPGLEHITLYVQSRFLWDADLDVDEVLDEYCQLFYGPAAKEMKAAIDFAEANLALKDQSRSRGRGDPRNVTLRTALKLRDLLDQAKAAAGDTVYGQRVQAVISDLQPRADVVAAYQKQDAELAQARANAPIASGITGADLSKATAYTLRLDRSNDDPTAETTFRIGWDQNTLLLDILCREPAMDKLKVSGDVHNGDYVAISIETPNHTYYHIEINPDGGLVEGNPTQGWQSLADVNTEKGPDFWRVHLRIPVVGDAEAEADPNHRVAGPKPTAEYPWHFNLGRIRIADLETSEQQVFSRTGGGWHSPDKFGKLVIE